jgi:hypothetical protein
MTEPYPDYNSFIKSEAADGIGDWLAKPTISAI